MDRFTPDPEPVPMAEGDPRTGFHLGEGYTPMWFKQDGFELEPVGGLVWVIDSDGETPIQPAEKRIELHIRDFREVEAWVAFWGKELRRRGWVADYVDKL